MVSSEKQIAPINLVAAQWRLHQKSLKAALNAVATAQTKEHVENAMNDNDNISAANMEKFITMTTQATASEIDKMQHAHFEKHGDFERMRRQQDDTDDKMEKLRSALSLVQRDLAEECAGSEETQACVAEELEQSNERAE